MERAAAVLNDPDVSRRAHTVGIGLLVAGMLVLFGWPWVYGQFFDRSPQAREMKRLRAELAADPESLQTRLRLAELYRDAGGHRSARRLLESTVRLFPGEATVWYLLGMVYLDLGNTKRAEGALKEAARLNPDSSATYVGLGIAYRRSNRYEDAVQVLQEASRLNPDSAVIQDWLAESLEKTGLTEDAARARKEAARLRAEAEDKRMADKKAKE